MEFLEKISDKWNLLCSKVGPVLAAIAHFVNQTGEVLLLIGETFLKFRKIFLAVPVIWASVQLALWNMDQLPESVGLDLQVDGTYAFLITRELAIWGPVVVTIFCLLLMLCSRRILTPWLVSVMTLLIPIFLWVTNVFPS